MNNWVAFATGTYYHLNAIYENLGREKPLALPVFHGFTGCDTTSTFFGRGKKSAWEASITFPFSVSASMMLATHVDILLPTWHTIQRLMMNISNCLNVSISFRTTRPVIYSILMKPGKSSFTRKGKTMESFIILQTQFSKF